MQRGLLIVSFLTLFLPWGVSRSILMTADDSGNVYGFESGPGKLLVTLAIASVLISMVERMMQRRMAFAHLAFLVAALLCGLSSGIVSPLVLSWGFYANLMVVCVLFPVSAMLSPGGERT